jgi:tetratricopeptide (TPR) repeat protein
VPEEFDAGYLKEGGLRFGRLRYGEHKWDNYLVDIARGQVESTKYLGRAISSAQGFVSESQSKDIAKLSDALGASLEHQSSQFADAVDDIYSNLRGELQANSDRALDAFERLSDAQEIQTSRVVDLLDVMQSRLYMGFSVLDERLQVQIQLSHQILEKLAGIEGILNNPTSTQAQEFLRLGETHLTQGLDTEALELLKRSETLYTVNPALHIYMGQIYLASAEHQNREEARKHFRLAVRYADAIKADLGESVWMRARDRACRGLATVAFTESSDAKCVGDSERAAKLLLETIDLISYSPRSSKTEYLRSAALVLSGKKQESLIAMRLVVDRLPQLLIEAIADPNFGEILDDLKRIPETIHADRESLTHKLEEFMSTAETLVAAHEQFLEDKTRKPIPPGDWTNCIGAVRQDLRNPGIFRERVRKNLGSVISQFIQSSASVMEGLRNEISTLKAGMMQPVRSVEVVVERSSFSSPSGASPTYNRPPFPAEQFTKSMLILALKGIPVLLVVNLLVSAIVGFSHDYSTNHQMPYDPESWGLLHAYWPCFFILLAAVVGIRTVWAISQYGQAVAKAKEAFAQSCDYHEKREEERVRKEGLRFQEEVKRQAGLYRQALSNYESQTARYNADNQNLLNLTNTLSQIQQMSELCQSLIVRIRGVGLVLRTDRNQTVLVPEDFVA